MDAVDKTILLALDENCRLSYQSLAERVGITATAIRKRFEKLVSTGVIESFDIILKPAMVGSDYLIVLIETDGEEDEEEFIHAIGSNVHVVQVGQIVTHSGRLYMAHCEYISAEVLQNLGILFRKMDHVTNLEFHTILIDCGKEMILKGLHLRVLKELLTDARMQISEISEKSGLTARRVSNLIQEMHDSDAFWFATRWNLSLGGNSEFYLRVEFNEQVKNTEEIETWFKETYSLEYWYSFYSAMEPVFFAKFVTDHFTKAEHITRSVKESDFTKSVDLLLSYPVTKFPRLGRLRIERLIEEASI